METLRRSNLNAEIAPLLRELIGRGELRGGERINEVRLAARLGVSRTPLREALFHLASEGFVVVAPRRGFFVRELDAAEVGNLYGVRAVLDPAALELAGLPPAEVLEGLEALNEEIARSAADASQVIDLDDRWHLTLLSHGSNPLLLELIRRYMERTRPLEYAYLRERANVETLLAEHRRVLALLGDGDLAGAVEALRQNMRSGRAALLGWLAERAGPSGAGHT